MFSSGIEFVKMTTATKDMLLWKSLYSFSNSIIFQRATNFLEFSDVSSGFRVLRMCFMMLLQPRPLDGVLVVLWRISLKFSWDLSETAGSFPEILLVPIEILEEFHWSLLESRKPAWKAPETPLKFPETILITYKFLKKSRKHTILPFWKVSETLEPRWNTYESPLRPTEVSWNLYDTPMKKNLNPPWNLHVSHLVTSFPRFCLILPKSIIPNSKRSMYKHANFHWSKNTMIPWHFFCNPRHEWCV